MTESRMDGFAFPLRRWHGLDAVTKVALYTRVSLQSVPVAFAVVIPVTFFRNSDVVISPLLAVAISGYVAVLALLAVITLELHPDLSTRERKSVIPIFRAGIVVSLSGVVLSLLVLLLPGISQEIRSAAVVVAMMTLFIFALVYAPWLKFSWFIVLAVTLILAWILNMTHSVELWWLPVPLMLNLTGKVSVWTLTVMKEIERSRELEASLRVTEERLRFAQELHDTLGQHLAAMSVKSELALALARRGDKRLDVELQELQQLTRISMSEMRDVVKGYRSIDLQREIDGARSLLDDAQITLHVHGDCRDVGLATSELAAWFVREATTNVLRHSDAQSVDLTLSAQEVSMINDGAHGALGRLSGLGALRQRAEAAGATLIVEREGTVFRAAVVIGGEET